MKIKPLRWREKEKYYYAYSGIEDMDGEEESYTIFKEDDGTFYSGHNGTSYYVLEEAMNDCESLHKHRIRSIIESCIISENNHD